MKRVAIVQARMTSSRLPGKVLADLAGSPMLAQQLRRLRSCAAVDEIVVATTALPSDDAVVDLSRREGVGWFRGDEGDVLGRYIGAARETAADLIVRITADCPLIDAGVVDAVIARATAAEMCDYASNIRRRTFPRGLDAEAFHRDVLERVGRLGRSPAAREHVTWFVVSERPELFVCADVTQGRDDSDLRWTVDTAEDLEMMRRLYAAAGLPERSVPFDDLVGLVRSRPDIRALNEGVRQRPLG